MGSLFTPNLYGWGGWSQDDLYQQVQHYRQWTYVGGHAICKKVASLMPNFAYVSDHEIPGHTVKANQRGLMSVMGRGFGGTGFVGDEVTKTSSLADPKSTSCVQHGSPNYASKWEPNATSSGGGSFLTMGEYRSKALSVLKPHEHIEPVEHDHPLRRLWDNPNPYDTSFDFMYEAAMFLTLTGSFYPWMVPNMMPDPKPAELWVMPSHWVWPRTGGGHITGVDGGNGNAAFNREYGAEWWKDSDRIVKYYEIRPWGTVGTAGMLKIPPSDMCHVKWKSPLDKVRGYSPLGAIAQWVDSEESITKSRWAQFQNIARPDLFIQLGAGYEDATDDQIERTSAKIDQKLRGEYNYGRTMIGTPGMTVTPLSFNPSEMAYKDCHDCETECLTADGWKKYTELTVNTKIACYDPKTKSIVYQTPSRVVVDDYEGIMHKWSGQRISAMLTPNHRCYVERGTTKMVGGETIYNVISERIWDVVRAGEMATASEYNLLAAAPAAYLEPSPVPIDDYAVAKSRTVSWSKWMEPKAWLKFLGYYISEGCISGYDVDICQKKHVESFRDGINATEFAWSESSVNGCYHWRTTERGLREHLTEFCGSISNDKKIPRYVMEWSAEYLVILFDALMLGDGSRREFIRGNDGQETWYGQYYTTSRQLADDVMELAVKCGYVASVSDRFVTGIGTFPNGTERRDSTSFVVNISPKARLSLTPDMRSEVQYKGKIWCVTVPTGLFVVRRNGHAHITGNSEADIRDMILSALGVPKAWVGIVSEMTFGSILATLMSFCEATMNPMLSMMGMSLTKHLASRWDEEHSPWSTLQGTGHGAAGSIRKVKMWWDNMTPADPAQVNSDLTTDAQFKGLTPNELRAMRGRPSYKFGGDDPMGSAGDVPIPLNTGDDLEDLAKLMAPMEDPKTNLEAAGEASVEGVPMAGKLAHDDDNMADAAEEVADGANDGGEVEKPNGKPSKSLNRRRTKGWIGVDLDGTLAHYDGWVSDEFVGEPVPAMVDRVRGWLDEGRDVRVFTARVATDKDGSVRRVVEDWCREHLGRVLTVTNVKDHDMEELWDDRAVRVERNTGERVKQFKAWCKRWIAKTDGPHEFSCVMALLDGEAWKVQQNFAGTISDGDLADKGREDQPHVTVFYGLHDSDAGPVRELVETFGPVRAVLGQLDYFPADEHDVVIIRVQSDDIHRLHEELAQLPNTDKYPEYQPHVTLAYVKPGLGQHWVDQLTAGTEDEQGVVDLAVEFSELVFSPADGVPTVIDIASYPAQEVGAPEKGFAFDTVQAAGKWLARRWQQLEDRYSRAGALAMATAMIATAPLPGNIAAVIAVAEGIRGARNQFKAGDRVASGRRGKGEVVKSAGSVVTVEWDRGGESDEDSGTLNLLAKAAEPPIVAKPPQQLYDEARQRLEKALEATT